MSVNICFYSLFLFGMVAVAPVRAADPYPARPVRLLIPFAPGGGADTLARIITPRLHESMGQPWVVDNRSGAAGNLAAEIVASANPDGHTALLGFSTVLTVNPSLYKLPFSIERDFQPVTLLANSHYTLVLNAKVPAGTLKEFIALAKAKPGSLNYASAGTGSPLHLAAELFQKRAGIRMTQVAYKGGGPAAASVLSGETQVIFGSTASTLPHVKSGRLKALATTGAKRSKVTPDLPTIAESGFPRFNVGSWYAMLLPAKTSLTIVRRLHDELFKAADAPEVQRAMSRQGLEQETGTPQEVSARIREETAMWAGVLKGAGIKAR
jgi:tripartite-type tricarboxylate transporter receptor subunit TctC